jgi:tRNA(Ile)-lysidine synthase
MNLEKQFSLFFSQMQIYPSNSKLLLAVSGGVDSMVMCHLLIKLKFRVEVAHCNFNLRGEESIRDENLVRTFAQKNNIPFHLIHFDTKKESKKLKRGIQETARILRYKWLNTIVKKHHFNYLVTAHHADDSVETILHHLIRGAGASGLKGISSAENKTLRPLSSFFKKDIVRYAQKNQVDFATDSSNLKTDYTRNFIRHKLIPIIEDINPKAKAHILHTASLMEFYAYCSQQYASHLWNKIANKNPSYPLEISVSNLKTQPFLSHILFEWFNKYGFTVSQIHQLIKCLDSNESKKFSSKTHYLFISRNALLLTDSSPSPDSFKPVSFSYHKKKITTPDRVYYISKHSSRAPYVFQKNTLSFSIDKLATTLTIRKWQPGDKFKPFGMTHSKKISDFLIDRKISPDKKDNCYVITDNKTIIAVLPYEINNDFAISDNTKNFISVSWL